MGVSESTYFASVKWRKSQNDFYRKLCLPSVRCQDIDELEMGQCHWCSLGTRVKSIVKRIGLIENNIHQMIVISYNWPIISFSFVRASHISVETISLAAQRNLCVLFFFFVNNSNVDFSLCCCLSVNVASILRKLCKIDWNKNREYATQTHSYTAKKKSWMESCFV